METKGLENMDEAMKALYKTVLSRRETKAEGSYTCYLFEKGLDKILKKCAEECGEVLIAAKNGNPEETVLEKRSEKAGNLKTFHQVDKNT